MSGRDVRISESNYDWSGGIFAVLYFLVSSSGIAEASYGSSGGEWVQGNLCFDLDQCRSGSNVSDSVLGNLRKHSSGPVFLRSECMETEKDESVYATGYSALFRLSRMVFYFGVVCRNRLACLSDPSCRLYFCVSDSTLRGVISSGSESQ